MSEPPPLAPAASRRAGSTSLCPSLKHRQPHASQGQLQRRTTCPARAQSPTAQARANMPREAGDPRHPQAVPRGTSRSLSTGAWVAGREQREGNAVLLRQREPEVLWWQREERGALQTAQIRSHGAAPRKELRPQPDVHLHVAKCRRSRRLSSSRTESH